jgi:TIR domain
MRSERGAGLTDIFISYSSHDRAVAERVRDALEEAGYSVFWDQSTPPGTDWDSWIREQLTAARLVVALWTKTSVASPNVRHEAIIAREAGKLLPAMVDELAPTDFPMGLFMVQALIVGRSARDWEAVKEKFLGEVRARIGAAGGPMPRRKRKPRRKLAIGLGIAALAVAIGLFFAWPLVSFVAHPDAPPVTRAHLQASIAAASLARQRVARAAENDLSGDPALIGSSWAWGAGQLIAAAPEESRDLGDRYFAYLRSVENAQCGCYYSDSIPHSIANAWVILAAARLGRPIPARLLGTVLAAQHPEGWWMISLNAASANENAAIHPTALLTIALAEARRAGIVPATQRAAVDAAIRRATVWLNRGPPEGAHWSDYPNNDRRTENLVFAAYATVATRVAGADDSQAAAAFLRSVQTLPATTEQFASGAYIPLTSGGRFFDDYRHPASPWIGAAAVMVYRGADLRRRWALSGLIGQWLDEDLGDENLLRQDWITGETLFLRWLAFRDLQTMPGMR